MPRVFPSCSTRARSGKANASVSKKKLPEALATAVCSVPFASVTITRAPSAPEPRQLSGSCPFGKSVPASAKIGVWFSPDPAFDSASPHDAVRAVARVELPSSVTL